MPLDATGHTQYMKQGQGPVKVKMGLGPCTEESEPCTEEGVQCRGRSPVQRKESSAEEGVLYIELECNIFNGTMWNPSPSGQV